MSSGILAPPPTYGSDLSNSVSDLLAPLSSQELFWNARYAGRDDVLVYLPFLFWLVKDLRPARAACLEIDQGVAHFALCQAMDKTGQDGICYGFGQWAEGEVPAALQEHSAREYEDTSRLTASRNDATAAEGFEDASLELIVVERACDVNRYEQVLSAWLPKLSKRCVVVLRCQRETVPHLKGFLDRNLSIMAYRHFEIGDEGLLILASPETRATGLRRLLQEPGDSAAMRGIIRMLSRLGTMHINAWRANESAAKLEALEQDLDDKRRALEEARIADEAAQVKLTELEAIRAEVTDQRQRLPLLEQENQQFKERQEMLDIELATHRAAALEHRQNLERIRTALLEQQRAYAQSAKPEPAPAAIDDAQLTALTDQLSRSHTENGNMRETLSNAQKETANLKDKLSITQEEADHLKGTLSQTQEEIQTLEKYRDKLRKQLKDQERAYKQAVSQKIALQTHVSALETHQAELRKSLSWRITAPLRRLRRTIK